MFKNTYQSGFISILFAGGSKPLGIWGEEVKNGHIRRVTDEDVQTLALELMGTNVATTYIICPSRKNDTLGIRLPFFIMIVKNMKKYFTFEITVLDDKNMSRRFRVSNYQSTTRVRPFSTCLPIGLTGGWNQIQFNLADFTRRAYGSSYLETLRVQIHANVRIRRIYFSDRLYAEDEMPHEFKLYVPITSKKDKETKVATEDKSTGADKVRVSVIAEAKPEEKAKEEEPSGAPPTPTETAREGTADTETAPDTAPEEAATEVEEPVEVSEEPLEEVEASETSAAPAAEEEGEVVQEATEEVAEAPEAPAEEVPPSTEETAPEEAPAEEPAAEAEPAAEEPVAEEPAAEAEPAE